MRSIVAEYYANMKYYLPFGNVAETSRLCKKGAENVELCEIVVRMQKCVKRRKRIC